MIYGVTNRENFRFMALEQKIRPSAFATRMFEYKHLKCDLDTMRVANALLTTSALQSVWTDIFAFPTTDCRLTKDGEVLTNCQTVYSLHENRVFPPETVFG